MWLWCNWFTLLRICCLSLWGNGGSCVRWAWFVRSGQNLQKKKKSTQRALKRQSQTSQFCLESIDILMPLCHLRRTSEVSNRWWSTVRHVAFNSTCTRVKWPWTDRSAARNDACARRVMRCRAEVLAWEPRNSLQQRERSRPRVCARMRCVIHKMEPARLWGNSLDSCRLTSRLEKYPASGSLYSLFFTTLSLSLFIAATLFATQSKSNHQSILYTHLALPDPYHLPPATVFVLRTFSWVFTQIHTRPLLLPFASYPITAHQAHRLIPL